MCNLSITIGWVNDHFSFLPASMEMNYKFTISTWLNTVIWSIHIPISIQISFFPICLTNKFSLIKLIKVSCLPVLVISLWDNQWSKIGNSSCRNIFINKLKMLSKVIMIDIMFSSILHIYCSYCIIMIIKSFIHVKCKEF